MDLATVGAVVGIVVAAGYLGPAVALYLSARAAEHRQARASQVEGERTGEPTSATERAEVPR